MNEIDLPNDVASLKALLLKAQDTIHQQQSQISILEQTIKHFLSKKYTASSERWEGQQLLFNEAEAQSEQVQKTETVSVKGFERKKRGRKPLPAHLPREEKVYELTDEERSCACGSELRAVGETVTETLKVIPAKMLVTKHIRKKYVCPCCDGKFKTAEMPKLPIPGSIASPELLAHITTSKYVDGMPLYRQEEMLRRIGVDIPRATLANWMIKTGELIRPLINLIREKIVECPVLVMDETHVQVLKEKGRKAQSKSFMWCMVGLDKQKKAVLFEYSPSRSAATANELLYGFSGTLVTDGYSGYKSVSSGLGIRHGGCWDHCRRKFKKAYDGIGQKQGFASQALNIINRLYAVERRYKSLGPKALGIARDLYSRAILKNLKRWLDVNINSVPPKSQTGQALSYLYNEWDYLTTFLEDSSIPISNETAENAIRPFVVGRKAWLFSASVNGAEASAAIYSLVESAKVSGIEPHAYLLKVFSSLPNMTTLQEIETLLPWNAIS